MHSVTAWGDTAPLLVCCISFLPCTALLLQKTEGLLNLHMQHFYLLLHNTFALHFLCKCLSRCSLSVTGTCNSSLARLASPAVNSVAYKNNAKCSESYSARQILLTYIRYAYFLLKSPYLALLQKRSDSMLCVSEEYMHAVLIFLGMCIQWCPGCLTRPRMHYSTWMD